MIAPNTIKEKTVYTLDLDFMGVAGAIAAYLIPHSGGAVLVESGPGSTSATLTARLSALGFTPADITDVLLTHIHLDHAGAAGWLARQGARIHVHHLGASHLLNPEKLLASAARIYGDLMQQLWGDFLPVPEERLSIHDDEDVIEVGDLRFRLLDTPGHAYHHLAYIYEDTCFAGDVGGVRMQGVRHVRLPMPPPEFHLEMWRQSVERLGAEYERGAFTRIAPTHFGLFNDPGWHLQALARGLKDIETWMEGLMPAGPSIEEINNSFLDWTARRSAADNLTPEQAAIYEAANPSWMSARGIYRYWTKVRNAGPGVE